MKFDLIVGNPPYEGKGKPLYLQILAKLIPFGKEVVWICPTQWTKAWKDIPYTAELKKTTLNCLIDHENVKNPFDGADISDITVYHFGEADKYEDYEDLKYERFSNVEVTKSIISKLESHESISEHSGGVDKNFYVNLSDIRGNEQSGNDSWFWYTLMNDELRHNFSKVPDPSRRKRIRFHFDTENECRNFISSIETDVSTFALYVLKVRSQVKNVFLEYIPWLNDYTRSWNDDQIAAELGLTKEELDYIHEEMKNFGWKCAKRTKK